MASRRHYTNVAPPVALTVGVNSSATTLTVASTAGYPSAPFTLGGERGTVNEEVMLCSAKTGTTFTVERGYDGTTAVAHASSTAIEHCVSSLDYDESNAHVTDTALDDHTQYLNSARHDVTARHAFGAALGTPAAAVAIGTSAAAGNGAEPARWNHVHVLGTGAINNTNMLGSGVVSRSALATTLLPIIQCTSGTHPSSPVEGQFIWETDTDNLLYYSGSAWVEYIARIPHTTVAKLIPTANNRVTGTAYLDYPTSVGGGPIQVTSFSKLRDSTKIIVGLQGSGYVNIATGHSFYLAVNDGTTDYEVARWYSNEVVYFYHMHHGGVIQITGLAAGTYTFKGRLKTESAAGVTAWENDAFDTWSISVTETF